jgi:hypothetical protein
MAAGKRQAPRLNAPRSPAGAGSPLRCDKLQGIFYHKVFRLEPISKMELAMLKVIKGKRWLQGG